MPENKRPTATDLKKLDAHVVQPSEYEDIPEWTEEELAQADLHEGGVPRRGRGRPPSPARKVAIKFRLDPDLVAKLRASGPGYQTRVNAVLREAVLRPTTRKAKKAAKATKAKPARKASRRKPKSKSKSGMEWLRSQRRKATAKR